jgi:hypothetical protein
MGPKKAVYHGVEVTATLPNSVTLRDLGVPTNVNVVIPTMPNFDTFFMLSNKENCLQTVISSHFHFYTMSTAIVPGKIL